MEDYIRGALCGYLGVQRGAKGDGRKKRMFLVLTDSRLDYYDSDPRPEFEKDIADAYIFTAATRVHHYVEINAKAPPNSLCLTTDKAARVFLAESDQEAQLWYRHLHERLEALASMVKGTLMLRKEISAKQQLKRLLLKTKYKWKQRYIELGRSSLRFCKESDKKTRMMKQFALTAQSFVGEESVEFLRQHRLLASYATAVEPDAKMLRRFKQEQRDLQYTNNAQLAAASAANPHKPSSGVAPAFPFVVATGQAHLYLAAPTESARADWVVAIRMRIISLKYRHNGAKNQSKAKDGDQDPAFQLRGFMDVQLKPGAEWKRLFVELDNDLVRVKASERKVGAKFETRLLPTCHVAPTLLKANALVLRNLGSEISLAPTSFKEAERWMTTLERSGKAVGLAKYHKIFEDDVRDLLKNSVVYNLVVPAGESAGLVVERYKKRIVVLSHHPPSLQDTTAAAGAPLKVLKRGASAGAVQQQLIPQGSALVAISQFEMAHESFETIWHTVRHKKGYQHRMTLTFRAPIVKQGVAGVRFRSRDPWVVCRCTLQHGRLSIVSLDATSASAVEHEVLTDLPLRHCRVELASEVGCRNGVKLTVSGAASSALSMTVLMNVAADADLFLWFALLRLEAAIAQDDPQYPLSVAALANSKNPHKRASRMCTDVAEDQKRCFQHCAVVGMRVAEIERVALVTDPLRCLQHNDDEGVCTEADGVSSKPLAPAACCHQLSEADSTAFFQLLDAIGCGKIQSSSLMRTMDTLTRHLAGPVALRKPAPQVSPKCDSEQPASASRGGVGVLSELVAALEALRESKLDAAPTLPSSPPPPSFPISMSEFLELMKSVVDADVVELVRKMARHDIQCM
ncbi:hypothetical protein PybrP1_009185 [[Pythium] brassicae (nom. inval.)]|nr:hypothetical protein PybrP1_009185 [[Pythium] brassicae (nom. inval.)]